MNPKTEEKILEELRQIKNLLVKVIPAHTEFTEEDVLRIVEAGDRADQKGETEELHTFLRREYPHLTHQTNQSH